MSKKDFVSLVELCPEIIIQADYATVDNFTGEVIPGYKAVKALLAHTPALALQKVQEKALSEGYSLKVFDAYRPSKAVRFFLEWSQREENNLSLKEIFYPKFSRSELFQAGYLAERSSHSRGCTIDLTLVNKESGEELEMGSRFDYFDSISNTDSPLIDSVHRKNRQVLKSLMEEHGFKNYAQEWWHFSYRPEPFPDQYFDFDID
jgi:D-alanyl-D-alanine dipeptidase